MAKREMQSASLKKDELACRRLELEARESAKRAAQAEVREMRRVMKRRWPSWRLRRPLIPERR